jgi:transcriptional regulator with XRE-family HTH domain
MMENSKVRPIDNVERNLAARVAYEREQRAWSYDTLSRELKRVGCAMAISSLNGIEKGEPPRRVRVNELYAFAKVFNLPIDDLVAPPSSYRLARLGEQLDQYLATVRSLIRTRADARVIELSLLSTARALPTADIAKLVEIWASNEWFDPPFTEELSAFLEGTSDQSPFKEAITGAAVEIPGQPSLLE